MKMLLHWWWFQTTFRWCSLGCPASHGRWYYFYICIYWWYASLRVRLIFYPKKSGFDEKRRLDSGKDDWKHHK